MNTYIKIVKNKKIKNIQLTKKSKTLYNDILTLEDKVNILEHLEKEYGLEKHFASSKALF